MSDRPDIYIPIRGFELAKSRMSARLDGDQRRRLARALADHTISQVRRSGIRPTVISGDADVTRWANEDGIACVTEPEPGGLNAAATRATELSDRWLVLHADLPLLRTGDLEAMDEASQAGPALAPSYDGGTTALSGRGPFPFSYGPASAQRHLRRVAAVVTRIGFLLDVDRPDDLDAAAGHPRGRWLRSILAGS